MYTIIPAYPTIQRAKLAASPQYATISEAYAALDTSAAIVVRVPARKTSGTVDVVAFMPSKLEAISAWNGRITVEGGTARASVCRHNNVGVPLIARTDEHELECFSCGAGIAA